MKRSVHVTLLSLVVLGVWAWCPKAARAATTVAGTVSFADLDGGALDEDPVPGVFGVAGDLVIEGTIECLDAQPLPGTASGCPVVLVVSGDLMIEAGGAIVTENRRGPGSGGDVILQVGGDLVLRGAASGLAGASISTEKTTGANPGGTARGGHVTVEVAGEVTLEAGSVISTGAQGGTGGSIELTAEGAILVAGLVASGPGSELTGNFVNGEVLSGGNSHQSGGPVTIRSATTGGPGVVVSLTGIVVSQGEHGGADSVALEACGVEVYGLVASLARDDGASSVTLRSGEGLLVDGTDLGTSPSDPGFQGRLGAVRAGGTHGGSAGQAAALYARGDVVVRGPSIGSGVGFAVSAGPGTAPGSTGGSITVLSLEGTLTATGEAFEAGRSRPGNAGGAIDLEAAGDILLGGAAVEAVGDLGNGKKGVGGAVFIQSHQGGVAWTDGVGDVRPVGAGVPAARSGSIAIFHCAAVDLAGTLFPTVGGPVPPFPELFQDCSSSGPELPPGEALPVCNQPPVAQDDDVTTDEDTPLPGDVLADNGHGPDSDPEGQPLTVTEVDGVAADVGSLVVLPSGAHLTLNADGSFTYDPNGQFEDLAPGETATDTFSYTIEDPGGLPDSATVTVTIDGVNDPPVAVDDAGTTSQDAVLTTVDPGAVGSLLANDTDPEGASLTVTAFQDPSTQGAAVQVNGDGTFSYDPTGMPAFQALAVSESLNDTFTYSVDDGAGGTATATVTVTVTGANDSPDAADDTGTTSENTVLSVVDPGATASLSANDVDPDASDSLTVVGFQNPSSLGASVAVAADGTFIYDPTAAPALQALAVGESALDTFTYAVSDGQGGTDTATVTITVTGANDAPAAVDDTGTTSEDAVLSVVDPGATASLLANDVDPDAADVLNVTAFQNPSAQGAAVAVNPDGTFTYDPSGVAVFQALRPGETAVDTFTYTAHDGHGADDTATVTLTILGANDGPVALDDLAVTVGNTELAAGSAAGSGLAYVLGATNLLANDADPAEGTALALVAAAGDLSGPPFTGPTVLGGEVTVFADGSFRYLPPAGVKDRTGAMADSFGYTVQDADGGTATAAVAIEIADALIWFVHNDPSAPGNPAGGDGRSSDPFDRLSDGLVDLAPDDAEDASSPGDTIFVFLGDGTITGQDRGIALQDGQSLVGHRAATLARGGLTVETPAPDARPRVANVDPAGDGVSVLASALGGDRRGIEIRGLEIEGADDAVEVSATGTADADLGIGDVVLRAAGTALQVDGSATSGTVTVTELSESAVTSATGGLVFEQVVFDADLDAPGLQPVVAGDVQVGDPANPGDVTGPGVRLDLVRGALVFGDLDVGNTGGAGIWVRDADGKIGTFALTTTGGTVVTMGGSALDVDPVTVDLVFDALTSVGAPGQGINFDTVVGSLLAGATTVQDAGGTGIRVTGSAAILDFGVATVDQSAGGAAVHLLNNTGTTRFGDLAVSTAASPGVVATNGGILQVLGTTSTVSATGGPALDLASTGFGGGATFAAVSSTGSPSHGLRLHNVGGAFSASGGAVSGASGPGILVSGGNSAVTYGGSVTNSVGRAVEVNGRTGGTVTIAGSITDAGATNAGILLDGNSGAVAFTGATTLTDTTGPALQVTGGTAAVSFAALAIQQTQGQPGIATSDVAGGSLILAGGSSVLVSGTGAGVDAVTLDGSGAAFDVTLPAVTLVTNAMRHGLVLSDLGPGSDVTIGGGTITSEGGGRRAVHFAGPTAGSFDLANVVLAADGSDGLALGAGETGTYQLGDLDVDAPNGGVGVTASGSPAAVSFRSVDQAGGATAISLAGTTGSFAVTGTGAAGSGGTISGLTGDAVHLAGARDVSLTSMVIDGNAGSGVFGDDVDGFVLAGSTVTGNGDTLNGSEANLRFHELLGSAMISGSTISGAFENEIRLTPQSGMLASLTVSDSVIGPNSPTTGAHGLSILAGGTANTTITVTGTTFAGNRASAILSTLADTAAQSLAVTGNVFRDNGAAVTLQTSGGADLEFEVIGNSEILRSASNAIQLVAGASSTNASIIRGTIAGNAIGDGILDSGSRDMFGIALDLRGDQDAVIEMSGNVIQNSDFEGVWVSSADFGANPAQQGRLDLTLRDNEVGAPDDNSAFPLGFVRGVLVDGRHTTAVCLDIAGNTSAGVGGGEHFRLRQRDTSTFHLERLTDGDATPGELIATVAVVEAHVAAENDPGSTADATLAAGFTEATSGFCRKP